MRCTDCSTEVKPVVALDIDGTLGDYHSHFLRFLGSYLGLAMLPAGRTLYKGERNFGDWICETFGINRDVYRRIKLAYRQGAQKRSMPLFGNARYLTEVIRAAGAELWMTTSRPYNSLDNVDPDTRFWLERHGLEYDFMLYDEAKYFMLRERVEPERVVAVLDDLPDLCMQAEMEFGAHVPIKRNSRWNKEARWDGWVVINLVEAQQEIVNRIEGWKEITE